MKYCSNCKEYFQKFEFFNIISLQIKGKNNNIQKLIDNYLVIILFYFLNINLI